ncbi:MAG: ankyrin repeat domain-containing protein [Elusimicrobiota bacterium]|jgi:hypothetical protein|nr:ankyrin repeat domain-containing protein [Elusimicrobiota bacterium]
MKKLSKGSIIKIVFYVLALAIALLPASSANAEAKQKPQAGAAVKTKISAKQEKKNQEFCDAVKNYYYGRVEEFLKAGQDPNTCPKEDCENYSTYMLKNYLLPYGFNLNTCDIDDMVSKFNLKEADFAKELVLKYGAKPSLVNVSDLATAEFMYEKGAEITDEAIEAAIQNNKTEAFKFFISKDDKIIEKAWKIIDGRHFVDKKDFVYSFEPDLEKIISKTDDKQLKEYLYEEMEKRIEMEIQDYPQEEQEEIRAKKYPKIYAKNKELCDAIENNDLEKVKQAFETGARWYWYCNFIGKEDDDYGDQGCLFENAMKKEKYEIAEVLLQHGAYLRDDCYRAVGADEGAYGSPVYTASYHIIDKANEGNFRPLDLLFKYQKYPDSDSLCFANKNVRRYILEKNINKINYYAGCIESEDFIDDKDFFELLLSKGTKPTLCYVKDVETAKYLLSKGTDVNYRGCAGSYCEGGYCLSVWESLIESGNVDVIKFLLNNGIKPDENALYYAVRSYSGRSNFEIAEYLAPKIENSQEIFEEISKDTHATPEAIAFALKHLPDIPGKEKCAEILPLGGAGTDKQHEKMREMLKADKSLLDCFDINDMVGNGLRVPVVERFVETADPNYSFNVDSHRTCSTLLMEIIHRYGYSDDVSLIKILIERGADVNLASKSGLSPLMVAVMNKNIEQIKLLLEHGARVDYKNPNQNHNSDVWTFLGEGATYRPDKNKEITEILLEAQKKQRAGASIQ